MHNDPFNPKLMLIINMTGKVPMELEVHEPYQCIYSKVVLEQIM